MKDEFVYSIGIWGQRHYNYLKKNSPTVINVMRMNGTLEQYLKDISRDARDISVAFVDIADKRTEEHSLYGAGVLRHLTDSRNHFIH